MHQLHGFTCISCHKSQTLIGQIGDPGGGGSEEAMHQKQDWLGLGDRLRAPARAGDSLNGQNVTVTRRYLKYVGDLTKFLIFTVEISLFNCFNFFYWFVFSIV